MQIYLDTYAVTLCYAICNICRCQNIHKYISGHFFKPTCHEDLPSGDRLHNYGKHNFQQVNQRTKWAIFLFANCKLVYRRVISYSLPPLLWRMIPAISHINITMNTLSGQKPQINSGDVQQPFLMKLALVLQIS